MGERGGLMMGQEVGLEVGEIGRVKLGKKWGRIKVEGNKGRVRGGEKGFNLLL